MAGNVRATIKYAPAVFLALWLGVFMVLFAVVVAFNLAPRALTESGPLIVEATTQNDALFSDEMRTPAVVGSDGLPEDAPRRIIIDAIGKDVQIENPASQRISALDDALTSGAVHYPGSGNLEDTSNMFIFGHSSHLPFVQNKAYQAFNDIENLEAGDLIRVQSEAAEYQYRVTSVREVSADEAWVRFDTSDRRLTLSTCNTFGSRQDRFVVEAEFVTRVTL